MNAVSPVTPARSRDTRIDMMALVERLFPMCRSLTGEGVRQTITELQNYIPVERIDVRSGTPVLDWHVPDEWNIQRATISTLSGQTLVDFADCNLHIMSYSQPFHGEVSREELAQHVHTLPDLPDAIPYRTGYYANTWGFCLSDRQWQGMTETAYRVDIDSTLEPGHLSYGELFFPGDSDDEILISVHLCHPSLANDNLSGIAVATALAAQELHRAQRRLGVRFLFVPATIGAIAWLARNEARVGKVRHGLVLTCIGDDGPFHYKQSRSGAGIDRVMAYVLGQSGVEHETLPFTPYGYDERQYCSPGFDLPVGCLMRAVHGTFPEYHTSLDNLDFISAGALEESLRLVAHAIDILQADRTYCRIDGRGEPQLGRRGLYRAIAGQQDANAADQLDLLWFLNLADGKHGLLDMAERAGVPFERIAAAARLATEAQLTVETA